MRSRHSSGLAAPLLALAILVGTAGTAPAQEAQQAEETGSWLGSLITETPEEGFALALTLSRRGVTSTQPDTTILHALREHYARDPEALIAVSHVVAVNFQTIAAANDYWR
jgi:Hexameric tyrosine-coordinated heme protein (HTHP)